MATQLPVHEFLLNSENQLLLDVRAETEYAGGHIPGAVNLPLFNDDERAVVGTLYKNSGREASVLRGLEIAGPKLPSFVKQLRRLTDNRQVFLHCWRGGMRSESMGWLFELAGYKVFILKGGYKAYRQYMHDYFLRPFKLTIIGGKTGSGKTSVLHALKKSGEQVIDLEELAHHKGSAFGGRVDGYQPSNEQFYNDLFKELYRLDPSRNTWVEDESRGIGRVAIPDSLYDQMSNSPLIVLDIPAEKRIGQLVSDYARLPAGHLYSCLERIAEKLGGGRLKIAREALEAGDFAKVAAISLEYYDKAYAHSIARRTSQDITYISPGSSSFEEIAWTLIETTKKTSNGSYLS